MDNKKLAQVIKLIVEKEIKRQLPKLIKEEVSKQVKLLKENTKPTKKSLVEEEVYDPFEMASKVLEEERSNQPTKQQPSFLQGRQLTKNPVLNEVLAQTQPFTPQQRNGNGGNGVSVLDNYQQPINEISGDISDYEEWPTMNTSLQPQPGLDDIRSSMRSQMEHQMGLNGGVQKGGLGVKTGLAGLDRILNRDNSELVKRFKK